MTGRFDAQALRVIFDRLAASYGPQGWWPARDPFEMMVGALLTQRTTWRNAERVIDSLRRAGGLSPEILAFLPTPRLETLGGPPEKLGGGDGARRWGRTGPL